jgi:hypothetical protein
MLRLQRQLSRQVRLGAGYESAKPKLTDDHVSPTEAFAAMLHKCWYLT